MHRSISKSQRSGLTHNVIPAKAGTQGHEHGACLPWVPAFAGMTVAEAEE
jgi:hypothetical protein